MPGVQGNIGDTWRVGDANDTVGSLYGTRPRKANNSADDRPSCFDDVRRESDTITRVARYV